MALRHGVTSRSAGRTKYISIVSTLTKFSPRLEALFANRVGDPMDTAELEETRKEAKRRIEAKIPPGYMDRGKSDPSGDYIL
jgi:PIN like domain